MPVEFKCIDGRLKLHGLVYHSHALEKTSTFKRLRGMEGAEIRGYVLEVSVRKAWVQIDNRIVEVDASASSTKEEQYFILLQELEQAEAMKSAQEYDRKEDQRAEEELGKQEFEEHTGYKFDGGSVRRGRAARATAENQATSWHGWSQRMSVLIAPWEERLDVCQNDDAIAQKLRVRPVPLEGLQLLQADEAATRLDLALQKIHVPSQQELQVIKRILGTAKAYAATFHADVQTHIRMVYDLRAQLGMEPNTQMITSLAGLGK